MNLIWIYMDFYGFPRISRALPASLATFFKVSGPKKRIAAPKITSNSEVPSPKSLRAVRGLSPLVLTLPGNLGASSLDLADKLVAWKGRPRKGLSA